MIDILDWQTSHSINNKDTTSTTDQSMMRIKSHHSLDPINSNDSSGWRNKQYFLELIFGILPVQSFLLVIKVAAVVI